MDIEPDYQCSITVVEDERGKKRYLVERTNSVGDVYTTVCFSITGVLHLIKGTLEEVT